MSDVNNFEGAVGNRALTGFRNNKVSPLIGFVVAVFLAGCSPDSDEHTDSTDVPGGQTPTERMEEQAVSEAAAQPEPAVAEPLATPAENGRSATPAQPEPTVPQPPSATAAQPSAIDAAVARNIDTLTAIPGVVNVDSATCNAAPCIRITVTRRTQSMLAKLPASVEGYPVMVAERNSGH